MCAEYISDLSGKWRAASLQFVNGKTTTGRFFLKGFERRWPELWQHGAGTIEEGPARNSRPNGLAHWFMTLQVLYDGLRILSPRRVRNMDETLIKERESAGKNRESIFRSKNMTKPKVVMSEFASEAGACTAAFTVSVAGILPTNLVVVEGASPGNAFVRVTDSNGTTTAAA